MVTPRNEILDRLAAVIFNRGMDRFKISLALPSGEEKTVVVWSFGPDAAVDEALADNPGARVLDVQDESLLEQ